MERELTHDRLLELLDYDPATGVFTWKVSRSNRVKIGSRAGVFHHASGGRYISIGDERFMAHRLAWFYVHKRWPNTDVRPNDGDFDHCALSNLKEVTRVQLQHERGSIQNNTSGYPGVSRSQKGKWQAKITWNYKQLSLGGNFETAEDAAEVRQEAERRLKGAKTVPEQEKALDELRIWKGQKTAWRFLERSNDPHAWESFEAFCANVTDVPVMRYAMAPIDVVKPIGPGNFRWAFPPEASRQTPEGIKEYNRVRRLENRDFERHKDFKRKYGIDFAEYQRRLLEQNGVCAICSKPETKMQNGSIRLLSVDHNHATGAVRGLLCANCNMAIGYACDDVSVLRECIAYLEKDQAKVIPFEKRNPDRDWLVVASLGFGA